MSPYVRTNPSGIARTRATMRARRDSLSSRSGITESCPLTKGWVGATAEQRDRFPAVAGGDRAVRPEALAERLECLGGRRRVELPREAVALTHAEIVDGPDVEPAQLEHQVHLGSPAADAAHRGERRKEFLVAEPRRPFEVDAAVEDLRGQVA